MRCTCPCREIRRTKKLGYYCICNIFPFLVDRIFNVRPLQDDMLIRVYNYNTLERLHQFEAHSDYIRSVVVHPTQSYILTSSGMLSADCFLEKELSCLCV